MEVSVFVAQPPCGAIPRCLCFRFRRCLCLCCFLFGQHLIRCNSFRGDSFFLSLCFFLCNQLAIGTVDSCVSTCPVSFAAGFNLCVQLLHHSSVVLGVVPRSTRVDISQLAGVELAEVKRTRLGQCGAEESLHLWCSLLKRFLSFFVFLEVRSVFLRSFTVNL